MKLINGDCLEHLKTLPDNSIDLIVTDPPYDVSVRNGGGSVNKIKKFKDTLTDVRQMDNGYDIVGIGKEFIRVLKNINIYIFCNKKQIPEYFDFYVKENGCKFDILFWSKTNALPTYHNKYLSDTEYLMYFRKGGKCSPTNYEDAKTLYLAPINHKDKKKYGHPTIKPLDLCEKIIRNSSQKGDTVLDPFMGSGTTGVACKKLGRDFIGVESNKEYFEIAKERIENANN